MTILYWFVCLLMVWLVKTQLNLGSWVWWVFGILTVIGIVIEIIGSME